MVDEDKSRLYLNFGGYYKTSDFMIDSLCQWWEPLSETEKQAISNCGTLGGRN
ncbi:hypothetical protein [Microcystis aeruginosa]|uniref:hypothetical protein n=1 Tax=Microcystis aeruginosa TaxID=1126 RepID=UPI001EE7B99B|nr:hypothetical protein [Microcystis aeruginosa]